MPKKRPVASSAKEPDLTHVLVVGEAEMRAPIIEQARSLGYSHWAAGNHKAAVNSFKNGLRAAVVVVAMTSFDEARVFTAWVSENHPAATIVFVASDARIRIAGAKEVVKKDVLMQKLPAILNWHIEPR